MSAENRGPTRAPAVRAHSRTAPGLVDPETLRQMFRPRIEARITALRTAVERLPESGRDGLGEVERQLHSLAGVGGTCGFPQISVMASDAELRCRGAVEAARDMSRADAQFLLQTVEALSRLIANR